MFHNIRLKKSSLVMGQINAKLEMVFVVLVCCYVSGAAGYCLQSFGSG